MLPGAYGRRECFSVCIGSRGLYRVVIKQVALKSCYSAQFLKPFRTNGAVNE